jgi:hypothetical protein
VSFVAFTGKGEPPRRTPCPRPPRQPFPWVLVALFLLLVVVLACCQSCSARDLGFFAHDAPPAPPGGADLNSLLLWIVGGAIVGVGGSIAAAIWMRSALIGLAGVAGFGAMIVSAVSLKVVQPYLGWFVGGGAALFAAITILVVHKLNLSRTVAVLFGSDMEHATTAAEVAAVKRSHSAFQKLLGVKPLVDRTLKTAKAATEKA